MSSPQQTLEEKLKALRQAYAKQLPKKLDDVTALWSSLCNDGWDWSKIEDLYRFVHTLAGSAPTFGFNKVGTDARSVEHIFKTWIARKNEASSDERDSVSEMISTLVHFDKEPLAPLPETKPDTSTPGWVLRQADMNLVYLIDNDHDFTRDLAMQLSHFDYQVKIFEDSAKLDKAMEKERPSAIIANVPLPEGDLAGIALIRGLKAHYSTSMPIIFISKNNDFESRLQAVRAGGDAYFVKPLNIAPLVDRLDQLTHDHENEPFRVLIIDDDEPLATHYSLILEQAGMKATIVTDSKKVITTLAEVRPELILMDVYMPVCSGLELAKLIRQQDAYMGIPIVYLSSETNLEKQFQAMRMGGDDFLTKPIPDKSLVASAMIRAERSRALNTLMAQDSLTGLLKHTKIKEQLAAEVSRASRANTPLSFAMIDIDHFKVVNDNYGHLTGDRIIKSLARLLQQRLRQSDSIGRYGGEEFAAVLPGCTLENAQTVFDEIRKDFSGLHFLHDGKKVKITISIGLADIRHFSKPEDINRAADEALYSAKNKGRNRVELAQASRQTRNEKMH